ncbi:MAG TPA: serine protease [Candidatus Acidoferrum sp.]|nr:serine protease [Candidatus Acidoferrum sp.]
MLPHRSILPRKFSLPRTLPFFAFLIAIPFAVALSALPGNSIPSNTSAEVSLNAALCPVVYPDDQTPRARGFHYTFFGNAFFINDQGYLLTVAHVLETFRNGGQPYILVDRLDAPPQLLKVTVIASDLQHDVAILRATPNPFARRYNVAFIPLASSDAAKGESVLALSLHPKRLAAAQSFEAEQEDNSPGTVLSYESTQLQASGPPADVFLLSHPVVKGQSGSPILDTKTHAAVGLVEGLWLRGVVLSKSSALPTNTPGAAVPIRYALALLSQNHIPWHPPKISSSQKSPQ